MFIVLRSWIMFSYASIGAILMSQKVADGIRDHSGLWKHGHTYQAFPILSYFNPL
jgi:adenosylmethionine-8-amino-7-oxononanoate aminotransferase